MLKNIPAVFVPFGHSMSDSDVMNIYHHSDTFKVVFNIRNIRSFQLAHIPYKKILDVSVVNIFRVGITVPTSGKKTVWQHHILTRAML